MSHCSHYTRRCSLVAPCCDKVYKCRFCHDEIEQHEMNRSSVEQIVCRQCDKRQSLNTHCEECGIRFGLYTCLECRLFDDTDKEQFHCDKCGLCRVGGSKNYFHCDICDICLRKNLLESHKCRIESGKDRCPVCFESVHSSAQPSFVPTCGHLIHAHCHKLILKFGHRRCPICNQDYKTTQAAPLSVVSVSVTAQADNVDALNDIIMQVMQQQQQFEQANVPQLQAVLEAVNINASPDAVLAVNVNDVPDVINNNNAGDSNNNNVNNSASLASNNASSTVPISNDTVINSTPLVSNNVNDGGPTSNSGDSATNSSGDTQNNSASTNANHESNNC